MSISKSKPGPHGPSLLLFLFATVTFLLVLATRGVVASQDPELDLNEDAGDEDDEPVGASRGWGGNNKTEHLLRKDFPWIFVLFRNPDKTYRTPQDGYQTGYALELQQNLFLANINAIHRASKPLRTMGGGLDLMAAKRAQDIGLLDPNKNQWPPDGERGLGNITLVQSIGSNYGIFRLKPWASKEAGSESRQHIPELDPSSQVHQYPIKNKDESLATNCYLYTFAAPDYVDAAEAATAVYGLPRPNVKIEELFPANELRYFTRSPVKLTDPCDEKRVCRFEFDRARYKEEHAQGKYSAGRARLCGLWQDAGAPIMCGDKPPSTKGYSEQGVYYERQYLKLSYIVEVPFSHVACTDDHIMAFRLAVSADHDALGPWGK